MRTGRLRGSFRIANQRRSFEMYADPWITNGERRVSRIIESIQRDLDQGGTARVRQILNGPRELYRIELERPDMAYQRTTILDREALTRLLEETPESVIRHALDL